MPSLTTQIDNSDKVEHLIRKALNEISADIKNRMTINHRHASHASERSLRVETDSVSGTLYGSKSFLAMETGRKAGKVPFRFQDIIAQWIIDKGISVTNRGGVRSAAFLIARSIKQNGTSLYRQGQQQDIYRTAMTNGVEKLSNDILTLVDSDISYIVTRFANPTNK